MNNRPLILKGNVELQNNKDYLMGKIIKNKNVDEIDKCNYIQLLDNENINQFEKGYKGYIFEKANKNMDINNIDYCFNVKEAKTLLDFDVVEILSNGIIKVLYRDDSADNVIVVTNQCNSNCIMCPDSEMVRRSKENPYIEKLIEQVRYIPDDTEHLTITGGEPGMLKSNLIRLLSECKKCLPNTEFLLLSNGRVFSNSKFTDEIKENLPLKTTIAIPIYSNNEKTHDAIIRTKGGFKQTITGIKKLLEKEIEIEIRIVVMKKNYKELENIADYIVEEIPNVKYINFMALEMTGNALKNQENIWVNFEDVKEYLYKACIKTIKAGILTNLYNFPLCSLDERLYSIARKSITDYKVRYKEDCEKCLVKDKCGGFFNSTINIKNIKVKPIC